MRCGRVRFFRTLVGLRHAAACYLLAFLAAVAFAPYRHANSLEDLLSDGPSDSGVFLERAGPAVAANGLHWARARLVDDDPCIACFHHDWATEPIALLTITPGFSPILSAPTLDEAPVRSALVRSQRCRAPPVFA